MRLKFSFPVDPVDPVDPVYQHKANSILLEKKKDKRRSSFSVYITEWIKTVFVCCVCFKLGIKLQIKQCVSLCTGTTTLTGLCIAIGCVYGASVSQHVCFPELTHAQ